MNNNIMKLASKLPEQYQPIYKLDNLNNKSSRSCEDRLDVLKGIVHELQREYGRSLRVLDLGCAQGYFCFNLACLGCEVTGVDLTTQNIALCNAIAENNPTLKCNFEHGDVVDKIDSVKPGDFDLVLGLSIFHHICYYQSKELVTTKFNELRKKCDVFLYEAALRTEPVFWAESLPEFPEKMIEHFPFYCKLGTFKTHLSGVVRPMFFCSSKFWYVDNNLERFNNVKHFAHSQGVAMDGVRRYYYSEEKFLKLYYFRKEYVSEQKKQITNEIENYRNYADIESAVTPSFISGQLYEEWGYVVLKKIDGFLISELLRKESFDIPVKYILTVILDFLENLEEKNLYYSDLRTWNVMLTKNNELKVIDIASINNKPEDCDWPYNIYVNFILFVYEITNGSLLRKDFLRQLKLSPVWMTSQSEIWIQKLWSVSYKDWSFKLIKEIYKTEYKTDDSFPVHPLNMYMWMGIMEDFIYRSTGFYSLEDCLMHKNNEIAHLSKELTRCNNELLSLTEAYTEIRRSKAWHMLKFASKKLFPHDSLRRKTVKCFVKPIISLINCSNK